MMEAKIQIIDEGVLLPVDFPRLVPARKYAKVATLRKGVTQERDIHACCYIVSGATEGGKTTFCRMLTQAAMLDNIPVMHIELDEPQTRMMTPARALYENPGALKDVARAIAGRAIISNSTLCLAAFKCYVSLFSQLAERARGGTLVLDSIWRYIALGSSVMETPAPKGGVAPGYSSAVELLDELAMRYKVAIFATQNTTLFPIPQMDGASGGAVKPYGGATTALIKDRNIRVNQEITFHNSVLQAAREM